MAFEEMRQYFTRIQLCKYIDGYNFNYKKVALSSDGYHLFRMVLN